MKFFGSTSKAVAAAATTALLAFAAQAQAGGVTLVDTYYGGDNTYNGADVIGDLGVFSIDSLTAERVGPDNDTLRITITTDYAGKPGTPAAEGTGYGALFLTPGADAWNPAGTAPYSDDTYQPGEWTYAVTIPQTPTTASGAAALYAVKDGDVVMSNVFGDTITAPYAGSLDGWYFRADQAVQFIPGMNANPLAAGSWSIGSDTVTFDVVDNGLLGDDFAVSWAMTCANDVIQGQIDLPGVSGAPEPSTWLLMISGLGAIGAALRMQRPYSRRVQTA